MNLYKKRCRVCVDIAIDIFTKGEKKIHRLMLDNNPCDPFVIIDDNEEIEDVKSDVVSDVQLNEVLQNEVHMNKLSN